MSAPEEINDPHDQRQDEAQNDASDDWEIEAAVAALVGDVARKSAESKWQPAPEEKQSSDSDEKEADNEQQFAEFAKRISVLHTLILASGFRNARHTGCGLGFMK
jgi:hypothetical protein